MWKAVAFAAMAALFVMSSAQLRAEGPLSPEEAKQKLEERQRQRASERDKLVYVRAGELEDLRMEVVRLKAELASYRVKPGDPAIPPAPSPSPLATKVRKHYTTVEIGMSRAELQQLVGDPINGWRQVNTSFSQTANGGKEETIEYGHFVKYRVQTGTRSLGQSVSQPIYDSRERQDKRMFVTLANDLVTSARTE